jgi:hypothetical protein
VESIPPLNDVLLSVPVPIKVPHPGLILVILSVNPPPEFFSYNVTTPNYIELLA